MTSPDIRAQFGVLLARAEQSMLAELRDSQVTHIDPAEYAPGSDRHERLWASIEQAQRYQHPRNPQCNV